MIITLKNLQEDTFTVEIDPSDTVRCLKEKIEKVKGSTYPAKHMKLMYAGKFLLDGNRVSEYSLEEKKFVIVVVKQPEESDDESIDEPSPLEDAFMNGTNNSTERERILCAEHERLVQHISELGYTREEAENALRASYNNPDRAADYLFNNVESGITLRSRPPRTVIIPYVGPVRFGNAETSETRAPPTSSNSILPSPERVSEIFSEATTRCDNSRAAVNHSQMARSYPVLDASSVPNLQEMFSDGDQEEDDLQDDEYMSLESMEQNGALGHLSDQDHQAIYRLRQLGFSEEKVVEAFFVSEKNENAAADYLFTHYEL